MSSEIPGERPSDFSQQRPPDGAGYGAAPTARPRRNGMGTAALVVGVVALVLVVLILFAPLGAFLGLVALVLGIVGLVRANRGQADNRGQAVAGLVTGARRPGPRGLRRATRTQARSVATGVFSSPWAALGPQTSWTARTATVTGGQSTPRLAVLPAGSSTRRSSLTTTRPACQRASGGHGEPCRARLVPAPDPTPLLRPAGPTAPAQGSGDPTPAAAPAFHLSHLTASASSVT